MWVAEKEGGGGEEGVAEGGAHDERPRNNQPHQLDSTRGGQGEDYDSNKSVEKESQLIK